MMRWKACRAPAIGLAWIGLAACVQVGDGEGGGGAPDAAPPPEQDEPDAGGQPIEDRCEAPDMLVLLDRTQSMHRTPTGTVPANTVDGRKTSKWWIAVTAIEALSEDLEEGIRFGLALFPRDPGGDACVLLEERIAGTTATNPHCEAGEQLVAPVEYAGDDIAKAIDPELTPLCNTTPIGAGLDTARAELAAIAEPEREQYVLFVGDGKDTCDDDLPAPIVIANTQALAAAGVRTFVVAFDGTDGGIDNSMLNHMACAGQTAPDFPAPCVDDGAGNFTAAAPEGTPLYLRAENAEELAAGLGGIAAEVSCNVVE